MEPWFVESQALSVSCNYELIVWAAVMMNNQNKLQESQDNGNQGDNEVTEGAAGDSASLQEDADMRFDMRPPQGGVIEIQTCESPMRSHPTTPCNVPHTYVTPWHEYLCNQMEAGNTADAILMRSPSGPLTLSRSRSMLSSAQVEVTSGATPMEIDSEDEG